EMLCLEGMQAGLSWRLILQKRNAYQEAFYHFDYHQIANMTDEMLEALLVSDVNIIKNRNKIFAIRNNAQKFLETQKKYGSFASYIWAYTQNKQIINNWEHPEDMPVKTTLSEKVSKDLKKIGFKFVGPVIIYSYLQAIGVVNDHLLSCDFR